MLDRALAPVRRFPVATFLAIAFVWSWRPWFVALASGVPFPGIDPFGPLAAAVIVTLAVEGRPGLSRLVAKMVRWRAPLRSWALALGLPVVVSLAAAAANVALGARRPPAETVARWAEVLAAFPFVLVLAGPLGEEPGWRGFLLPRLRTGRSELGAALLVGAIWAGWHLPLLVSGPLGAEAVPLVASILAASVLLARLDALSGGSVLLAMIFHATQNTVGGEYLRPMFEGADAVRMAWLLAGLFALAAVVAALAARRRDHVRTRSAIPST
jgi:membrane protease YdiL (CAAX protease family)